MVGLEGQMINLVFDRNALRKEIEREQRRLMRKLEKKDRALKRRLHWRGSYGLYTAELLGLELHVYSPEPMRALRFCYTVYSSSGNVVAKKSTCLTRSAAKRAAHRAACLYLGGVSSKRVAAALGAGKPVPFSMGCRVVPEEKCPLCLENASK